MKTVSINFKKRLLALAIIFGLIVVTMFSFSLKADAVTILYAGGYAITLNERTVYNDLGCTTYKGKLFKDESFTVLGKYPNESVYMIEYSTSSGTREGYIKVDNSIDDKTEVSSVATVKNYTDVYYGPNSNKYQRAGSVSADERVAVVSLVDDWTYIEYNTVKGRKRGYVLTSNLLFNSLKPSSYGLSFFEKKPRVEPEEIAVTTYHTVYAGPTKEYVEVGSVGSTPENVIQRGLMKVGNTYSLFIEYSVTNSNQKKCGFVFFE